MYLLSAWMHFHPAAEDLELMSNLWHKSNFDCRKPLWKVMQAGALWAVDLKEGEAPPALLLLPGAQSWQSFKRNPFWGVWYLSSCVREQRGSTEEFN